MYNFAYVYIWNKNKFTPTSIWFAQKEFLVEVVHDFVQLQSKYSKTPQ